MAVPLTPQASSDLAWLKATLGTRCRGITQRQADYVVTLVRRVPSRDYPNQWDERMQWHIGKTPEEALSRARAEVEAVIAARTA